MLATISRHSPKSNHSGPILANIKPSLFETAIGAEFAAHAVVENPRVEFLAAFAGRQSHQEGARQEGDIFTHQSP